MAGSFFSSPLERGCVGQGVGRGVFGAMLANMRSGLTHPCPSQEGNPLLGPYIANRLLARKLSSRAVAHSERRLFTGLANAARMVWNAEVASATINNPLAQTANTHQLISVRLAKSCIHKFIA